MANTFKSTGASVSQTGGAQVIYTATSGVTAILYGMTVANTFNAPIQVTVDLVKGGTAPFHVCYQSPVAVGDVLVFEDQKATIMASDQVKVTIVTTGGTADVVMSYVEIS